MNEDTVENPGGEGRQVGQELGKVSHWGPNGLFFLCKILGSFYVLFCKNSSVNPEKTRNSTLITGFPPPVARQVVNNPPV